MSISEIKSELHDLIDHAGEDKLMEIYDFFHSQNIGKAETLDDLPQWQRESIMQGLAEVEAGLTRPVEELLREIRCANNG